MPERVYCSRMIERPPLSPSGFPLSTSEASDSLYLRCNVECCTAAVATLQRLKRRLQRPSRLRDVLTKSERAQGPRCMLHVACCMLFVVRCMLSLVRCMFIMLRAHSRFDAKTTPKRAPIALCDTSRCVSDVFSAAPAPISPIPPAPSLCRSLAASRGFPAVLPRCSRAEPVRGSAGLTVDRRCAGRAL